MIRTYSELQWLETFEERFKYLKLTGSVGETTFGFDRYLNQRFYGSGEWKHIRHSVIARDNGCDLGISGYEIHYRPVIHHMNPINVADIIGRGDDILSLEFLITTTYTTHNAIHFGDESVLRKPFVERKGGDTKLW